MNAIIDVVLIVYTWLIQNSLLQFGEKGAEDMFYVYSSIRYIMNSRAEI